MRSKSICSTKTSRCLRNCVIPSFNGPFPGSSGTNLGSIHLTRKSDSDMRNESDSRMYRMHCLKQLCRVRVLSLSVSRSRSLSLSLLYSSLSPLCVDVDVDQSLCLASCFVLFFAQNAIPSLTWFFLCSERVKEQDAIISVVSKEISVFRSNYERLQSQLTACM